MYYGLQITQYQHKIHQFATIAERNAWVKQASATEYRTTLRRDMSEDRRDQYVVETVEMVQHGWYHYMYQSGGRYAYAYPRNFANQVDVYYIPPNLVKDWEREAAHINDEGGDAGWCTWEEAGRICRGQQERLDNGQKIYGSSIISLWEGGWVMDIEISEAEEALAA